MTVLLFTSENGGLVRSGYLGGTFGRFGALRGAPGMMDGQCSTPGGEGGETNQKDLAGDRFQVTVPLFTYENAA